MLSLLLHLRSKVQELVGDMNGQYSIRLQMAAVEFNGLGSQQVHWNSISGERVYHQDVIALRRFISQREPRIAMDHFNLRLGLTQIGEGVAGDRFYLRVDLIKTEHVSSASVSGQRAGPQPNHAHAARSLVTAQVHGQSYS